MQHGNDRANSIMQITVVQFQSTEVKKKKMVRECMTQQVKKATTKYQREVKANR